MIWCRSCTRHQSHEGWSIVSQFCNGGNLTSFIECFEEKGIPVLEGMIWHVLVSLARVVAWLHFGWDEEEEELPEGWKPVVHTDIVPGNIFLDFEDAEIVPKVMLGDFGESRPPFEGEFRDEHGVPSVDMIMIGIVVRMLMLAMWRPETDQGERQMLANGIDGDQSWKSYVPPGVYSQELWDCAALLDGNAASPPNALELVERLLRAGEEWLWELEPADVRWTRPLLSDKPAVFPEYCRRVRNKN